MNSPAYYIGLMSGTSADGIDLALVDFSGERTKLAASYYQAYDDATRAHITSLYLPGSNEIDQAFALDKFLATCFADAIHAFLNEQALTPNDIIAIGNHGQTIRHRPKTKDNTNPAFTLQIGCNQTLACLTGIEVIGQFRQKDIALGGQGAPLVPAFHRHLISCQEQDTFIVNIGGIANITYLPRDESKAVLGFDTGPGNALMDDWFQQHQRGHYDENGNWAASGSINQVLIEQLLADEYFSQTIPKSTGREVFNLSWLSPFLSSMNIRPQDVQATLTALTATTIADAINPLSSDGQIYLCGGGVHNVFLHQLLKSNLPTFSVASIEQIGINSDSLEAMAFAWLAFAYKNNIPSNMPSVTGAAESTTLGVLFTP
ncbi:anhydro-N-acetylmuramic acid kinase [Thalassotalea atypica]|uniref:anhydro-N-acetylmuramic acid kinase n=1 Tax=Thalassotalea atypica TaxID=2054316 RepID=UPI002574769F|nr:anhydro-N-acetylmuramic acid kinase [Thalassotalea atypica]